VYLYAQVRTVYLTHLRECLLNNYLTYYERKDDNIQNVQVNKCADQMELNAVRLALETSLYRQNMLRLVRDICKFCLTFCSRYLYLFLSIQIANVKSYTIQKKLYKKLILEIPDNKINAATQTDDTWMSLHDINDIKDRCVESDYEEPLSHASAMSSCDFSYDNKEIAEEIDDQTNLRLRQTLEKQEFHNVDREIMNITDSQMMDDDVKNEDDDSQDSLLRHMEDMFCESDDSSDLTQLIEKHPDITKASIDKEIHEICLETANANMNDFGITGDNDTAKCHIPKIGTSRGKLTFSRYKEMRSKMVKEVNGNETLEEKRKRKKNAIWFVERVHQISKLRIKMTELSLINYRKHGRVKGKFLYLFGDSEKEEMMPDSPICIEEHLPACKERIAPWIVRYLMPFYKKRKIKDRQLFKTVAKYIADMLIMKNTFPGKLMRSKIHHYVVVLIFSDEIPVLLIPVISERECVSKYIENYFKNKKFIKTKQDVYL